MKQIKKELGKKSTQFIQDVFKEIKDNKIDKDKELDAIVNSYLLAKDLNKDNLTPEENDLWAIDTLKEIIRSCLRLQRERNNTKNG